MTKRSTIRRRTGSVLVAALLALGLALGLPLAAAALPPDGPGPETPGTKSKVWPKKLKAGERLYFEVSGYPANETVYIKIDDGTMCSDTSHGACVYHTQKLNKKGYAKGSLVVPDLAPGKHWLRMLATGDVFDSKTGEKIGYKGYTRRGGNDFTVVAGGSSSQNAGGSGNTAGGGKANADGTIAGGSVEIELGEESTAPQESPTPDDSTGTDPDVTVSPAATEPAATPTPAASQAAPAVPETVDSGGGEPPVAGIAALAGSVVVGGGAVGWAVLRRNRLLKQAATPAAGGE
ncbi:MAG: hypothetical protein KIT69_07755 [Propionibacteriaceae bacterium]|nr:hypothetical protein [Propionibacteriaceae bacterium]